MYQRDRHGRFRNEGRVTTRWEYLICLSITGGILLGFILDSQNQPIVYVVEASVEQPREKVVLIEVVYDKAGIERLIRATFPETSNTAVAIAKAESELNPKAYNGEAHKGCNGSIGVMQIGCVHNRSNPKALHDVAFNLKKARAIYDDSLARTGNGWLPWGAYTDGRYKQYLE